MIKDSTKKWASEKFGIPEDEVLGYNFGSCYDSIAVRTKESANKVTEAVKEETVNGGWNDGMALGHQIFVSKNIPQVPEDYYSVMC